MVLNSVKASNEIVCMRKDYTTLKECLIEAGLWTEGDGDFEMSDHSCSIVMQRIQQKFEGGVLMIFNSGDKSDYEAYVAWNGQRQVLARGETIADTICNAAINLSTFLKDHPECSATQL